MSGLVGTIMGKTVTAENGSTTPITWVWRDPVGWFWKRSLITCNLGSNTNERRDVTLTFTVELNCENHRVMELVKELLPATHLK